MSIRTTTFPDGTPIDKWFYETDVPCIGATDKTYSLSDYGVLQNEVQTQAIQNVIDIAYANGGGVVYVPAGLYKTGALFFKQGVHLYVAEGAMLQGSDDIADYPLCQTRIEGETCTYFPALINADGVDGFCVFGNGTIDGNGFRAWQAFWTRLKWNPQAKNKDEQRPRLLFVSNSRNVTLAGVRLQNSHFWTTHMYKCRFVKYLGCSIYAPFEPVPAPSSDGIDIDVCEDVLIKGCTLEVNDDGVALKGGKGPWADTAPENGGNERVLIEDCTFIKVHSCLTCGSESIYDKNILMRNCTTDGAGALLYLKMRPDTPQFYEYITVEDMHGTSAVVLQITPWTQYFDLRDRKDIPLSYAQNITLQDCTCTCKMYCNVQACEEQYKLSKFTFKNLTIKTKDCSFDERIYTDAVVENVQIEQI